MLPTGNFCCQSIPLTQKSKNLAGNLGTGDDDVACLQYTLLFAIFVGIFGEEFDPHEKYCLIMCGWMSNDKKKVGLESYRPLYKNYGVMFCRIYSVFFSHLYRGKSWPICVCEQLCLGLYFI